MTFRHLIWVVGVAIGTTFVPAEAEASKSLGTIRACVGCTLTVSSDVGSDNALSGGNGQCHLSGTPSVCQQETACTPAGRTFDFKNTSNDVWTYSHLDSNGNEVGGTQIQPLQKLTLTIRANFPSQACGSPSVQVLSVRKTADHSLLGYIYVQCNPCTP